MSIQSEITRIGNAKTELISRLTELGISVPSGATIDEIVELMEIDVNTYEDGDGVRY